MNKNGLIYELVSVGSSKKVTIVGYDGTDKTLYIPSSIDNFPVYQIENSAFDNSNTLELISVPSSVTLIKSKAFSGAANLKKLLLFPKTPPQLVSSDIINNSSKDLSIIVDKEALNAYKTAQYWNGISNKIQSDNMYLILSKFSKSDREYISEKLEHLEAVKVYRLEYEVSSVGSAPTENEDRGIEFSNLLFNMKPGKRYIFSFHVDADFSSASYILSSRIQIYNSSGSIIEGNDCRTTMSNGGGVIAITSFDNKYGEAVYAKFLTWDYTDGDSFTFRGKLDVMEIG